MPGGRDTRVVWRTLLSVAALSCAVALAQQTPSQVEPVFNNEAVNANPATQTPKTVELDFPDDIPVSVLADYVSRRAGLSLLYDKATANKTVTIRAPRPIPIDALPQILQSTLKIQGLLLVPMNVPDWYRVTEAANLPQFAAPVPGQAVGKFSNPAATQLFSLQYITPAKADSFIKPFLTKPGASSIALEGSNLLAVTDYESNLKRIAAILEQIDVSPDRRQVQFLEVQHVTAQSLATQLNEILKLDVGDGVASADADSTQRPRAQITPDQRTNRLIVAGSTEEIRTITELAKQLDVALDDRTEVYTPAAVSAARVASLLSETLPSHLLGRYRATVDEQTNSLVVIGPDAVHERIGKLLDGLGTAEANTERGLIRFYKLEHATALELVETLRSLQGDTGEEPPPVTGPPTAGRFDLLNEFRPPVGPNQANLNPDAGVRERGQQSRLNLENQPPEPPGFVDTRPDGQAFLGGLIPGAGAGNASSTAAQGGLVAELLSLARVSADVPSNSVIIVAEPVVQQMYAALIKKLDQPRPQVLIEAQVVTLDTSDGFRLGVEVSGGDRLGVRRVFGFSSFGLSQVDAVSGALSIVPGVGFNGTLVDPDVADAVVRAFTMHRRSKIISAPRVMVNDNETGTLTSVFEVPFTSVNASQTVATTSFAGFAEAGTTIIVTPHISKDDELQLEYQIILNSFTGTGQDGVPPPRQTNEIQSVVTIPDGHTLIVGGLNQTNYAEEKSGIPFVEHIPVVKHLAGVKDETTSESSLFVFLKPIILRNDKFRGLKYLSERDSNRADVPGTYPTSQPILIER